MAVTFADLGNKGRCGNQLFQIATTIACAIDNNDNYLFPSWSHEEHFGLHGCFGAMTNRDVYTEPYFQHAPIPYRPNLNLNGYFQSYLYFDHHRSTIKRLLTPNYNLERSSAVSIHVRRTDYLNFPNHHNNLTMNYYKEAMELCPSERYLVFSDDIEWCRNNFKGEKFEFVQNNHECYDLKLMSMCSGNIVANSSFSWWAAYLNDTMDKKIIAPSRWFGPALPHDTKDLCPPEWIRI